MSASERAFSFSIMFLRCDITVLSFISILSAISLFMNPLLRRTATSTSRADCYTPLFCFITIGGIGIAP